MRRRRALIALWATVTFGCGALAVAWRADHQRMLCYRDFADEELVAESPCEHPPLWSRTRGP